MATHDSIQTAHGETFSRKNMKPYNSAIGRLHKGHGAVAATASIPSKFQTIVIRNNEKKGFGSCSGRFDLNAEANDSPGPAKYDTPSSLLVEQNVSLSKKGLGGFASKVKRFPLRQHDNPIGPGQYNPKLRSENYFNQSGCTSNFHQPIAVQRDVKQNTPAPNEYKMNMNNIGGKDYDNASAAFISRTKRELITMKAANAVPAPTTYNINDSATRANPRAAVAPFKSTSDRLLRPRSERNPGPGTYHPFEHISPIERNNITRKHYLCISAPPVQMPPDPPIPGPGTYDLVDYGGPEEKLASSSVFVSSTNRWQGNTSAPSKTPGPSTYHPSQSGKQSFIYNADKKWI